MKAFQPNNVRVRFAPSPTGALHIGGLRTALYNYLFAKKNNGKFILRIEDTDQKRTVKQAEKYIMNALMWSGLKPDESSVAPGKFGPYKQSERKHIYKRHIEELIAKGQAYYAFDTPEELFAIRKEKILYAPRPKRILSSLFKGNCLYKGLPLTSMCLQNHLHYYDN